MPLHELLELGLLLLELGVGELLDLELVCDLEQESLTDGYELGVLGVAGRVPGIDELGSVEIAKWLPQYRERLPTDLGDQIAKLLERRAEVVGMRERDHGLLKMERARPTDFSPDRDTGA